MTDAPATESAFVPEPMTRRRVARLALPVVAEYSLQVAVLAVNTFLVSQAGDIALAGKIQQIPLLRPGRQRGDQRGPTRRRIFREQHGRIPRQPGRRERPQPAQHRSRLAKVLAHQRRDADHARTTQQHDHMQVPPDAEVFPPLPQIVERQMALAARRLAQPLPVIAQAQPLARAGEHTGFDAIPAGNAACRQRRGMIKLLCGF